MNMKRIFVIIPMLLAVVAAFGQAEKTDRQKPVIARRIMARIEAGAANENKGFSMYSFGAKLGYEVLPRLCAFALYEGQTGLYEKDGAEGICHSEIVGGGVGYSIYKASGQAGDKVSIECRAMMGASVGNSDLSQTVYEAGVVVKLGTGTVTPTVGLAFRHTSMHTQGADNYNGLMATIGFGL